MLVGAEWASRWVVSTYLSSDAPAALGLAMHDAPAAPVVPAWARADHDLDRDAQTLLPGAVLYVPPSFHSVDGRFDLVIHFHGNVELIEQSVAAAGLNALVYIRNLGTAPRRYTDAFSTAELFEELVEQGVNTAREQGLKNPQVQRIALSAWSAGGAAVRQVLRNRPERIDAVLLMDAMHAPFTNPHTRKLDDEHLEPFVSFSKRAAAGEKLLVITHSNVGTFDYASAAETADAIIAANGLTRKKIVGGKSLRVTFDAAIRATPSHYHEGLVPASEARKNGLQVLGFRGDRAEHHGAHMVQMSVTVLPPLAQRWKE
jgi:hypothetical protein